MDMDRWEWEDQSNDNDVFITAASHPNLAHFRNIMKVVNILIFLRIPLGCITFILNCISIRIFWLITSDKAPPIYVLLFGLSIARIISCLYAISGWAYAAIMGTSGHYKKIPSELRFWLYSILHHLLYPFYEMAETAIVWLLVMVSIERVQHYFRCQFVRKCFRNRHECIKILIWVYLFALAFNVCRFFEVRFAVETPHPNYPDGMGVTYDSLYPEWYYEVYWMIVCGIVNMFLPYPLLAIFSVFNGISAIKTRSVVVGVDGSQEIDSNRQRLLTIAVAITCFSFVLFTSPFHIFHWVWQKEERTIPYQYLYLFYTIAQLLLLFNMAVSFIMYLIYLADFRGKFFEMFVLRMKWMQWLAGRFRNRFLSGHNAISVAYQRGVDMDDDEIQPE